MAVNPSLLAIAAAVFSNDDERLTTLDRVAIGLVVGLVGSTILNKVAESRLPPPPATP